MLGAWCFQARRPSTACDRTLIPNKQQSRWRKACLTKINDDPRGVVLFNLVAAGGVVLACWPHASWGWGVDQHQTVLS